MQLEHDHSSEAIRQRLLADNTPNYLRDWVYGGIDGSITTFAIVAGVVGAGLSSKGILILGVANLLADGLSMAASNYSGTKTEVDELARFREIEERHVEIDPDGERNEIREILKLKGLGGPALEDAVAAITSNRKTWIDTMLVEEYGLSTNLRSPFRSGASTFVSFILFGLIPLLPYMAGLARAFEVALVATLAAFFLIGMVKSRWSLAPWWRSGLETLLIGSSAALLAFGVGWLAERIIA